MKSSDVRIGQTYLAKVTDKVVPVRIDAERPASGGGGWDATNMATGKKVRIKTAQRLRGRAPAPAPAAAAATGKHEAGAKPAAPAGRAKKSLTPREAEARRKALKAQHHADQENARLRDEREASEDGMTASERAMAATAAEVAAPDAAEAGSASEARAEPERDTAATDATDAKPRGKAKRPSLINAAAQVLAEADEPLGARDMVERAIERGLWTPGAGKTPQATLYSAILREINDKGEASRFVKTERGRFTVRKGA